MMQVVLKVRKIFSRWLNLKIFGFKILRQRFSLTGLTQNITKVAVIHELPLRKNKVFGHILRKSCLSLLTLLLVITFFNKSFLPLIGISTAVAVTPKSRVVRVENDVISFPIALKSENHAKAERRKEEIILNHSDANGFDVIQTPKLSKNEEVLSKVLSNTTAPASLVQMGKKYYHAKQYTEAIAIWQQAHKMLVSQRDSLNEGLVLGNLAQAYQQLGNFKEANKAITRSLELLSPFEKENPNFLAGVLNVQGSLLLSEGKTEDALAAWLRGAEIYKKAGNQVGLTRCLLNQTQALNALGIHRRAMATLKEVKQTLESQPDSPLKVAILINLGDTLRVMGDFDGSEKALQKSLEIAKGYKLGSGKLDSEKLDSEKLNSEKLDSEKLDSEKLDSEKLDSEKLDSEKLNSEKLAFSKLNFDSDISQIFLALGNTVHFAGNNEEAVKYYDEAISTSKSPITKIQAQLNLLAILLNDKDKQPQALALAAEIKPELQNLPPSRTSVYALVNYVKSLESLESLEKLDRLEKLKGVENLEHLEHLESSENPQNSGVSKISSRQENAKILATAVQQAKSIGDNRAESYALGYLGEMYEQSQQLDLAQTLTEKALIVSLAGNAADISYRWQWQLGRLHKKQSHFPEAIAAYNQAIITLRYIRNELVASNLDIQFSFRESVEPVYREFVSLLLTDYQGKVSQENLKKAREVLESLQLAELDNYFHESCLKSHPTQIDNVDAQAAVIYPIILSDRLEIILSLPKQPLRHYSAAITPGDLETKVQKMNKAIGRSFVKNSHFLILQEFYNLLIKPLAADLSASGVKTLAFVLDGSLKSVPMAGLHDGQQYLVEKYNIALAPGIQLLAPQPLKKQEFKILVGGLTEGRQGFSPLPAVEKEVEQIKSEIPIEALLNQKFTSQTLQKQISKTPFPVVHLATHGEFSSKAEDTFVLTWDNRLNVKELGDILQSRQQGNRNPIELLVMSACKTASGDKRAPLGLAGVAVRSGARSTVASLWSVDDQSTSQLMAKFYQGLTKSGVTKAEALRNAQIQLMKQPEFQHPYYWAPFVLVGNWL